MSISEPCLTIYAFSCPPFRITSGRPYRQAELSTVASACCNNLPTFALHCHLHRVSFLLVHRLGAVIFGRNTALHRRPRAPRALSHKNVHLPSAICFAHHSVCRVLQ
jgi:hypothetical protein